MNRSNNTPPAVADTSTPTPTPTAVIPTPSGSVVPNPKTTTTADGIMITDVKIGGGAVAASGQTVTVNYVGTLTDGTKFDSSIDRGTPFSFLLGAGQVIKGWDEGVVGMKVGGERKLVIPAALAYGDQAQGSIPANSVLDFDITLLSIK
jgi:peptidylprolyl isomerase